MDKINMNGIKIDNMNGVDVVNAPAVPPEIENEVEDTLKDAPESTNEQAHNKHVGTYIGNSEYIDSVNHKWRKHDEMTYTDEDYGARTDLHFMVKYGEMKHTVVSM